MESLKPILLLIVLGGVGYAVYVALNHAPQADSEPHLVSDRDKGGTASGDRTSTGGRSSVGAGAKQDISGDAWKNPAPSSAPGQPSGDSSSAASSLPFGVGSANLQLQSSDPWPRGKAASATVTGITSVDPSSNLQTVRAPNSIALDSQTRHEYETANRSAQSFLAKGQLVEALRELSRWYDHPAVPPQEQAALADLLGQLAGTVIYSRQAWLWPNHVARAGESLESIAAQYQVPWQLLAKINGIDNPRAITPGEELKVVRGPFHAQLNRQQDWLTLFVDELYAGRFRVQGGQGVTKPDGTYPVAKFAADHPSNAARQPYISLGGDLHITFGGPAVTGNPAPAALQISQPDMQEVFDILSERSQVTIRR